MTTTIEQIKSALRQHIAEAEAATPGTWKFSWNEDDPLHEVIQYPSNDPEIAYRRVAYTHKEDDANFIAHARTMSPAACKCLLLAIEGLEIVAKATTPIQHGEDSDGQPYTSHFSTSEASQAKRRLESIRQEWHNQTNL